tara:strand:- start:5312 stop:5851 length:540 start_codon:yes stop_codon:yes gene_type:complete
MQGDVRIDAPTLKDLYDVVQKNRFDNGIPVGDVTHDVNSQLCGRFPRNCKGGEIVSESLTLSMSDGVSPLDKLIEDATGWAINFVKRVEPFALLPDAHADSRAAICERCPANKSYRGACPTCVANLVRNSALVRQGRGTKLTEKLGACAILRHDNRTAVFLSSDALSTSQDLPERCWLK